MRTGIAHSTQQKSGSMAAGCIGLSRKRGGAPTGDRTGAPASKHIKRDFIMTTQETIFLRSLIRYSLKNSTFQFSAIRLRIRVNGERLTYYLPVEYKICPRHWDAEAGEAITSPKRNPDIKADPMLAVSLLNLNKELDRTSDAFVEAYQEIKLAELPLTVEGIKAAMRIKLGRVEEQVPEVLPEVEAEPEPEQPRFDGLWEFMGFYIENCEKGAILNSKGLALSPGTIRSYKSARAAIDRYNKARRRKLGLHTFSIDDYHDIIAYMNSSQHKRGSYALNVVGKTFKDIRLILRYAHEHGYTDNQTYKHRDFKIYQTTVQTVYLNEQELESLRALQLPENQKTVVECFLISAYTGLRYSDMARLEEKHVHWDTNTISIVTQKTTTPVIIPIHPVVKEILERNGNKPPQAQSNQANNRMLKKLCEKAGITEPVTVMEIRGGKQVEVTRPKYEMVSSHTARRSFCNAYKSGIPTISLMRMSGHGSESNFLRYVRIGQEENAAILQDHKFFNGNHN